MPRRREAQALVGEYAGQVGRIESLGVKNVQVGTCDVLITFDSAPDQESGAYSPINTYAFEPGEWERITPPVVRTGAQRVRDRESKQRGRQRRYDDGWKQTHRDGWVRDGPAG